jgi:DNA-binding transcriptional MerR regulator
LLALLSYNASMLDARQIAEIVRSQDRDLEVSPSTLHYYVQVGILPPAVGRGRSGYTPEHLSRFRLARRLKREGAGLAEIRERLGRMTSGEISAELSSPPAARSRARSVSVAAGPAPPTVREPGPAGPGGHGSADEVAARYRLAAEALRARPDGTPRTLRFRGGFSLQVPAGTPDEQIARLYTAIEAVLNAEKEEPR